jgi:hypothetical protein
MAMKGYFIGAVVIGLGFFLCWLPTALRQHPTGDELYGCTVERQWGCK